MRARWVVAAVLAAAAIAVPLGFAAPAYAHNVVIDSSPHAGDVLTQLPDAFSITTNEPLLDLDGSSGFAIQIRDAAGAYYGDGCVVVVDATMSAAPALGSPGEYTMLWQAVSADGHTIDGEIPFTWSPLGTVGKMARAQDSPPVCGVTPGEGTSAPTASPDPIAEGPTASGIDLATVLWIGGALLAAGIAVAVAIALAGRKKA